MGGIFGRSKAPAAPVVDETQEQKVAAQEEKVDRQEAGEQRKIQARRRSKRTSGRSQLMASNVGLGDDTPGRRVVKNILGTGGLRSPR